MTQFLEGAMMICFGVSWPFQLAKTIRVKNPTGKSFLFLFLLIAGYLCGIAGKLASGKLEPVLVLYIANTLMVGADFLLSLHYLSRLHKTTLQQGKA